VLAFVDNWIEAIVVRVLLGLLAGGTISLAYTMGARMAPSERSSLTLSVLASCGMLGSASSPILAGMLSQVSLRAVFLATAAAYLIAVVLTIIPGWRARSAARAERADEEAAIVGGPGESQGA
jgi:MFS family permease